MTARGMVVAAIGESQRAQMLALMQRYYANLRPEKFAADLAEKQYATLLLDPGTGDVCGLSTQMVFDVEAGGNRLRVLFSGIRLAKSGIAAIRC